MLPFPCRGQENVPVWVVVSVMTMAAGRVIITLVIWRRWRCRGGVSVAARVSGVEMIAA